MSKHNDGGIVGNNESSLTDLINKLFDTKPNEEIVKVLKGEIKIPEGKFNFSISEIKDLIDQKELNKLLSKIEIPPKKDE